jgi:hypothetical protein
MDHRKVVNDLYRASKSGALDGPPRLSEGEVANFVGRLAQLPHSAADDLLMFAEDILSNEGGDKRALMLLNGMRAGIQQAHDAQGGGRVVAIWYDDHGARATFSWSGNDEVSTDLHQAIASALNSALRANGETST